ncbi:MAG: hypothetical protein K8S27_13630 [Candidatus Omnitrophica bacterium]|nr:hypothetical protein [Candidatus Omnitrophota bacterium]
MKTEDLIRKIIGVFLNSFVLPGLGQIVVGRTMTGIKIIGMMIGSMISIFVIVMVLGVGLNWVGIPIAIAILGFIGLIALYIYAIVDVIVGDVLPFSKSETYVPPETKSNKKVILSVAVTMAILVILFIGFVVVPLALEIYYNIGVIGEELSEDNTGIIVTNYSYVLEPFGVEQRIGENTYHVYLTANITNNNDFDIARAWIYVNYTDTNSRLKNEREEWFVLDGLKSGEKRTCVSSGWLGYTHMEHSEIDDYDFKKQFQNIHVTKINANKFK